jgi:hypothetical protein
MEVEVSQGDYWLGIAVLVIAVAWCTTVVVGTMKRIHHDIHYTRWLQRDMVRVLGHLDCTPASGSAR